MSLDIGKYKIESLDFAYNENNEVVTIKNAVKNTPYYLYENKETELIVAEGTINVKHFRTKSSSDNHINESPEHFRAKRKIVEDGYFIYRDAKIIPFRVVCEKQIFKGKRPDITFYNEDNSILCVIEVFKTCQKTQEDIKQFKKENITVYEYNINNGTTECISYSRINKKGLDEHIQIHTKLEDNRRIEAFRKDIEKAKRNIEQYSIGEVVSESQTEYTFNRLSKRNPDIEREIEEVEREINVFKEKHGFLGVKTMSRRIISNLPNTFKTKYGEVITNVPVFAMSLISQVKNNKDLKSSDNSYKNLVSLYKFIYNV